ncbi:MAG: Z1 domain-containing protein [Methylophilaceae bacterium]|nr:Z1 domain-containing protein [Methylophilaceae bacterium]
MNSYLRIKDYIYTNLLKQGSPLSDGQIKKEIEVCRSLIGKVGLNIFNQFLPNKDSLTELTDNEWSKMQQELETQFDVRMELGILIQGKNATDRDPVWWSSKRKQDSENYYWDRYRNYLALSLNADVTKTIDRDTDIVMDNIENPEISSFNRYGMVVGYVQSGKTGNYSALVCKAADAGYKFIVVIAGGMNNLRDQTQVRLNEYFVGQELGQQVGVGIGALDRKKLPISLTTKEKDFNKQDADQNSQGLNFDNINAPILLVIKKNTKTLANVITWLEKQYKNQIKNHSMLLIDDESDYASINTKEEQDPTTINKRIRKLLTLFQKSVYVAYTATPYANIFIDHQVGHGELGQDLFPKDFIYALDAPTNYFGAREVFLDSNNSHLISIADYAHSYPTKHKKDHQVNSLPESLKDAIRHFLLNIAIRNLRGQSNKHNSMLVHISRFTNIHQRTANIIETYLDKIKSDVRVFGMLSNATEQSCLLKDIKNTFETRLIDCGYDWPKTLVTLTSIISSVVLREVHQSTSIPLVYRTDIATNAIVVGGTSLSRGYTLEGLSISYFLRNTIFYDTLMQMGRWFGYRDGYHDLCKIYLPESSIDSFAQIIEASEDLIDDFKRMALAKMTPYDFGLAVKHHPNSGLQVTARNKQKNAKDIYFDMKLDGQGKETAWFVKDEKKLKNNLKLIITTVKNISATAQVEKNSSAYVWKNICKKYILDFLNKFEVYGADDELGFRTKMPIKFIVKYANDIDLNWDVALYSGSGDSFKINESLTIKKELRSLKDKGDHFEVGQRQVSSGSAESVVLDKEIAKKLGSDRKEIRRVMTRPLLMLHVLENKQPEPRYHENSLAAFGASFPGGIDSGNKTVRLKINTVFLQNLQEQLEDDAHDD